jgi:hypothetical protein
MSAGTPRCRVDQEVPLALKLLSPRGSVLLHDFFPNLHTLWVGENVTQGPCLAVERLRKEGARLEGRGLGVQPWPTKANSNVTSLALLVRV